MTWVRFLVYGCEALSKAKAVRTLHGMSTKTSWNFRAIERLREFELASLGN